MKIQIIAICFLISLTVAVQFQKTPSNKPDRSPKDDIVEGLNGDGTNGTVQYDLPWYSGMLDISTYMDTKGEKYQMHYWFFPSQNDATSDPVLLWLNGGPGCSSLLGALTEHGPFIFPDNATDNIHNAWSWNKFASVIYLESPPGVGFSTTTNYTFGDNSTASANLAAVRAFFDLFDSYNKLDFYISGESYAGIYVPTLAYWIDQYNSNSTKTGPKINLKGILVGNGATSPLEVPGLQYNQDIKNMILPYRIDYLYEQGVIPQDLYSDYRLKCLPNVTLPCNDTINAIDKLLNGLNIYNIDGICYPSSNNNNKNKYSYEAEQLFKFAQKGENQFQSTPPCANAKGALKLLNNQTVKSLLHLSDASIKYEMCSDQVGELFQPFNGSYYLYPYLVQQGYRIWIYSGDTDGAVPITGTLRWITQLRRQQFLDDIVPWQVWYQKMPGISTPQQGGTYWKMDGLTFVRFKGAGHMVPSDDGPGAYTLINAFLTGQSMPIIID